MILKIKQFFEPEEKMRILLFSFCYGLFFAILPAWIFSLAGATWRYSIPPLVSKYCSFLTLTFEDFFCLSLVSGAFSIIPGYLWHKKKAVGEVGYLFSALTWGIMLGLAVLTVFLSQEIILLMHVTATHHIIVLGFGIMVATVFLPISFVYGCFLGLLSNFLLRQTKFLNLLSSLFVGCFLILVFLGDHSVLFTWESDDVVAKVLRPRIDILIEQLGSQSHEVRTKTAQEILALDPYTTIAHLEGKLYLLGDKQSDKDMEMQIVELLGKISDDRATGALRGIYYTSNDKQIKYHALKNWCNKPLEQSGQSYLVFLTSQLDSKDVDILKPVIANLERIIKKSFKTQISDRDLSKEKMESEEKILSKAKQLKKWIYAHFDGIQRIIQNQWAAPQTCKYCNSNRMVHEFQPGLEKILYKSPTFAACSHTWRVGSSSAEKHPIFDGAIILVKKGRAYGAFIPTNQKTNPESLEYEWYYRRDGKGTFKGKESAKFKAGKGKDEKIKDGPSPKIRFGPFLIGWSGHAEGEGFVYYNRYPWEKIKPDDLRICITTETIIEDVDAADAKWLYKGSPVDPEK